MGTNAELMNGRKMSGSANALTTTSEIRLATIEVSTCAHRTDGRAIGMDWNRSLGRGLPLLREPDEPGTAVGRIRDAFHEPFPFQRRDQQARGLLGHLRLLSEVGEARAVLGNPLSNPGLRNPHIEVGFPHRRDHPFVHRAVGDKHERGDFHRIP